MKIKQLIVIILSFLIVEAVFSKPLPPRKILKMLKSSVILNDHFSGFSLFDLGKRKMITGQNQDKYFTPASNTKLFTFYAGLMLLKDSIAGLQYAERGDSLIFWGTADPSFLDPQFKEQSVLLKLKASGKKIYRAKGVFKEDFYGTGWTYDDYNEYYQPEMTDLPLYGNVVRFSRNSAGLQSYPEFIPGGVLKLQTDQSENHSRFSIKREIFSNVFHHPNSSPPVGFTQVIPFKVSDELIEDILKRTIPAFSGNIIYSKPSQTQTWNSVLSDTLYKKMLLPSDNFIAEQILLNIAASKGMEMNTAAVIDYVKENFLADLPDKAIWVDGSGLSRQNLFTPRSIVRLCEKIYDEIGDQDRLFDLLPQGGKTGTLKNLFIGDKSYVFAKTGSLSNNHNLSGYLITASGKKLIFSFMNNNFTRPTTEIRSEMEKLINEIHKKY
jgi:serine-type D-Ala-D-Ala carboxypeptidase/endopeptidase (penicillin-binding protein 4)